MLESRIVGPRGNLFLRLLQTLVSEFDTMKVHHAWFGPNSPDNWNRPSAAIFGGRKPDLYLDVAPTGERAKFDMILFADSVAVPTMAMMAAVTSKIGLAATLKDNLFQGRA